MIEDNEHFEQDISITLKLRHNDEFLFYYVMSVAEKIYSGEIPEYEDEDITSFEEAIEEAIGITLYSILNVLEIEDQEFEDEFNKTYTRVWNYGLKMNQTIWREEYE